MINRRVRKQSPHTCFIEQPNVVQKMVKIEPAFLGVALCEQPPNGHSRNQHPLPRPRQPVHKRSHQMLLNGKPQVWRLDPIASADSCDLGGKLRLRLGVSHMLNH